MAFDDIDPLDLRVYLNRPLPCPYLSDRVEQRLLIPLADAPEAAAAQLGFFTQLGFRRSQNFVYRPHCQGCNACISYRLPVSRFQPSRTQARTRQRNADLVWEERPSAQAGATLYTLFSAYQRQRHGDSDMASFSEGDFLTLMESTAQQTAADGRTIGTVCFTLKDGDRIVGAILTDRIDTGLSAVYSFYDPTLPARSLGTELVLRLVEQARAEARPYVYLGYWISACSKMAYKSQYRPAEILTEQGWQPLV